MSRNRSKFGILADKCPERMEKYQAKLHKLFKYKKELQEQLEDDITPKKFIQKDPTEFCEQRIDKFKILIKEIEAEIRELEKRLQISLKESKIFKREEKNKKHLTKSEKLKRGRKNGI